MFRKLHLPKYYLLPFLVIAFIIGIIVILAGYIVNREIIEKAPTQVPENTINYELLIPPDQNASTAAQQEFNDKVIQRAQVGNVVFIDDNCMVDPLVLLVQEPTEFKFKNEGTKERTIMFTSDQLYKVKPNESVIVNTSEFKNGTGTYGYICDKPRETALSGYIYLTP